MDIKEVDLNTEHRYNGKTYIVTEFFGDGNEIFIKLELKK